MQPMSDDINSKPSTTPSLFQDENDYRTVCNACQCGSTYIEPFTIVSLITIQWRMYGGKPAQEHV